MKEYEEEDQSPTPSKNKPKISVNPPSDSESRPVQPAPRVPEVQKKQHKKTEQQKKLYQEDIDQVKHILEEKVISSLIQSCEETPTEKH